MLRHVAALTSLRAFQHPFANTVADDHPCGADDGNAARSNPDADSLQVHEVHSAAITRARRVQKTQSIAVVRSMRTRTL
jgi:hypothetical protein